MATDSIDRDSNGNPMRSGLYVNIYEEDSVRYVLVNEGGRVSDDKFPLLNFNFGTKITTHYSKNLAPLENQDRAPADLIERSRALRVDAEHLRRNAEFIGKHLETPRTLKETEAMMSNRDEDLDLLG